MGLLEQTLVQESRAALLAAIGTGNDLTLLRGMGNAGDELIRAGTHALLRDRIYREVTIDELPSSSGDTVLLPGGGALCRPFHEWMPRALAVAELRFERVIVLPCSIDPTEDAVRATLSRTSATVFAREAESLRRIAGLCQARLAHDCAFFFDYSGLTRPGEGTLNAFRTDAEALGGAPTLADNEDISVSLSSLDVWLDAIARRRLVRTDRAHVMIAAALMGKEVEFAPSSYHKLDSIAETWLGDYPVRRIRLPRRPRGRPAAEPEPVAATRSRLMEVQPPPPPIDRSETRVTAVILTRDRPHHAANAIASVLETEVPARILVIGNNPSPASRRELERIAAESSIELRLSDRNLGCAGGRMLAGELVSTELMLFLDDDAELLPGALAHLIAELDQHPDAVGATGLVVGVDGGVQHFGGWIGESRDVASFTLECAGMAFDDPSLPPSGPIDWVPGTAALLRTAVLREIPLSGAMSAYYEDNEWCFRVHRRAPASFRRCREAVVLHHHRTGEPREFAARFLRCSMFVERLAAHATFLRTHGVLLGIDLERLVPGLARPDGTADPVSARLLLELVEARGTDWVLTEWMNGGLEPLLSVQQDAAARAALEQTRRKLDEEQAQRGLAEQHAARLTERLERRREQAEGSVQDARRMHERLAAAEASHDAAIRAREPEIAWLTERHETLRRVEAGGWWRLRARLLPLLRIVAAARRSIT